jgi:hypothetical protein
MLEYGEVVNVEIVEDDLVQVYEAMHAALPRVRWTLHREALVISGIAGVDVVRVMAGRGAWRAEVTGPWWGGLAWGEVAMKWLVLELPDAHALAAALGAALKAREVA